MAERQQRSDWLVAVPAFVAFALGLVYGLGAITIYGQLKGASLNGIESMAAVPLDQILSRGIGQAASSFGKAIVYVFFIALCAGMVYPWGTTEPPPPSEPEEPTRGLRHFVRATRWLMERPAIWFAIVLLAVGSAVVQLPKKEALASVITIAVALAMLVYILRFTRRREEFGIRRLIVVYGTVYMTYLVALVIATALLNPAPLPHVRLALRNSRSIEGGFVAESGGTWYVAQENKSVLAVSARRVRRSFITYPGRAKEESAWDWIGNGGASSIL